MGLFRLILFADSPIIHLHFAQTFFLWFSQSVHFKPHKFLTQKSISRTFPRRISVVVHLVSQSLVLCTETAHCPSLLFSGESLYISKCSLLHPFPSSCFRSDRQVAVHVRCFIQLRSSLNTFLSAAAVRCLRSRVTSDLHRRSHCCFFVFLYFNSYPRTFIHIHSLIGIHMKNYSEMAELWFSGFFWNFHCFYLWKAVCKEGCAQHWFF